jgi:hypothetical protein
MRSPEGEVLNWEQDKILLEEILFRYCQSHPTVIPEDLYMIWSPTCKKITSQSADRPRVARVADYVVPLVCGAGAVLELMIYGDQ